MADVRTPELVINKLTKQQYENIQNPSGTEMYLVPEDEEHKPICYPTTASEVKTTSMVVKSCVSDNGKILTENGFVYNTSGNPTINDIKVICDLGAGFFEKKLENLTRDTEYHIKSYGQNSSGVSYGSELIQRTIINPIPIEYQLVEYLESSGSQYIMPNVTNSEKLRFEFYNVTFNNVGTQYNALMGYYFNNGNDCIFLQRRTNNGDYQFSINGNALLYSTNIYIFDKISIDLINAIISYDDYYTQSITTSIPIANDQYHIFRINSDSGNIWHNFKGHCYRITISNNNGILRDFYPVYRISDFKPGMYDIVNNVFYTNQGTGEFTVGPDKEWDE